MNFCTCSTAYHLPLGCRSAIAILGYLIMQIGLWYAENRWDEMGSTAYLEAASSAGKVEGSGRGKAPEYLDTINFGDSVVISGTIYTYDVHSEGGPQKADDTTKVA